MRRVVILAENNAAEIDPVFIQKKVQDRVEFGISGAAAQRHHDPFQVKSFGFEKFRQVFDFGRVRRFVFTFHRQRAALFEKAGSGSDSAGNAGANPLLHHGLHETRRPCPLPQSGNEVLGGRVGSIEFRRGVERKALKHGQSLIFAGPDIDGNAVEQSHLFQSCPFSEHGVPKDRIVPLHERQAVYSPGDGIL